MATVATMSRYDRRASAPWSGSTTPSEQSSYRPSGLARTRLTENDVTPEDEMTPWLAAAWESINRLARLPNNADGYKSRSVQPRALQAARFVLRMANLIRPPQPEIVPSPLGGIDLVWWTGAKKLELIVGADGLLSYFLTDGGTVLDGDLEIGNIDSLIGLLRRFTRQIY